MVWYSEMRSKVFERFLEYVDWSFSFGLQEDVSLQSL